MFRCGGYIFLGQAKRPKTFNHLPPFLNESLLPPFFPGVVDSVEIVFIGPPGLAVRRQVFHQIQELLFKTVTIHPCFVEENEPEKRCPKEYGFLANLLVIKWDNGA